MFSRSLVAAVAATLTVVALNARAAVVQQTWRAVRDTAEPEEGFRSVAVDPAGGAWVTSDKGLLHYSPAGEVVVRDAGFHWRLSVNAAGDLRTVRESAAGSVLLAVDAAGGSWEAPILANAKPEAIYIHPEGLAQGPSGETGVASQIAWNLPGMTYWGLQLTQYSVAGVELWSTAFEAPAGTYITAGLAFDPIGNLVVAFTRTDVPEYTLAKLSPSGAVLWTRQLAGTFDTTGKQVAIDALGNVFFQTLDAIYMFSPDGTLRASAAVAADYFPQLAVAPSGEIVSAYARAADGAWVTKYHPGSLVERWTTSLGGGFQVRDLALDRRADVFISGTSMPGIWTWVLERTTTGAIVFRQSEPEYGYGTGIAVDPDGVTFYSAGLTYDFVDGYAGLLIRFDASGKW